MGTTLEIMSPVATAMLELRLVNTQVYASGIKVNIGW